MKFMRRPDLDCQTRVHIVMLAWLHQGVYGKMTQIAHSYQISRTFLYQPAIIQSSSSIHFWTDGQWNVNRNRRLPSHGMHGSTPALSSFASRLVRMAAAAAACSKP